MIHKIGKFLFGAKWGADPEPSIIEETFNGIYESNHWGNLESVSGAGSTLHYTQSLRKHLPDLFTKYKVETIFDAPSGDFNWMADVLGKAPLNYIGGEIVQDLIRKNTSRYASDTIKFVHFDITKQEFPKADFMAVP